MNKKINILENNLAIYKNCLFDGVIPFGTTILLTGKMVVTILA